MIVLHFLFFNVTPTTYIYTLSLHDALPIFDVRRKARQGQPALQDAHLAPAVAGAQHVVPERGVGRRRGRGDRRGQDRKSTRLNSSHSQISYAVFCLKKKKER